MSKIVYFVVGVDLDKKEPFIDDDVFMAKFGEDEQVYDTKTNLGWRAQDWTTEYLPALEILNTVPLAKE